MNAIVEAKYEGAAVHFTEGAWFNATEVAERFGKRVDHWLANQETKDYLEALHEFQNNAKERDLNTRDSGYLSGLIKTRRGKNGGTWMHPDLAVPFARWLDVRFGVWCDQQIKALLVGNHPHYDWKRLRHEATSSFKVMNQVLKFTRDEAGKASAPHHFSNEARLVNWALTGEFGKVDRDGLHADALDLLAKLEERNAVLIGRNVDYATRKKMLEQHALDWRLTRALPSSDRPALQEAS